MEKNDEIIEKLEKTSLIKIEVPSHKKNLKLLLSKSFEKETSKRIFAFVPFLKKYFATLTLIIFIFSAIFIQNFVVNQTVSAQEIIDKAIQNLNELNFEEQFMDEELRTSFSILQKALDADDLRYLGAEDLGDRITHVLTFTDPKIGFGLMINLTNDKEYDINLDSAYPRYYVDIDFANQYVGEGIDEYLEIPVKNKTINTDEIIKNFKDKNLDNELLKTFISRENERTVEGMQTMIKEYGEAFDAPFKDSGPNISELPQQPYLSDQEALDLIAPIIRNAGVFISYVHSRRDEEGKIKYLMFHYYRISELKKNREKALEILDETEEFLEDIENDEAKIKLEFLRKLENSTVLATSKSTKFDKYIYDEKGNAEGIFRDVDKVSADDCVVINRKEKECMGIEIFIDPEDKTENGVTFEFGPGGIDGFDISLKGDFKNDKIQNVKNIIDGLTDQNGDEALRYLVEEENTLKLNYFSHRGYKDIPIVINPATGTFGEINGGEITEGDIAGAKLRDLIEPIVANSNMLITGIDWERDEIGLIKNFEQFTITALPISDLLTPEQTSNKDEGKTLIEETMQALHPEAFEVSQKLSILKEARDAEDLKYEGKEELGNGKKVYKLSFTQIEDGIKLIIYIDPEDPSQKGVILPYIGYKKSVYFYGEKLENADVASIQAVGYAYLKDKNSVYFNGNKIEGADVHTFKIINEPFAKDKNSVYFAESKIPEADPDSFEAISDPGVSAKDLLYGKDKNAVYSPMGEKLAHIDPKTFEVVHQNIYKDKNGIYRDGIKVLETNALNTEIESFYDVAIPNYTDEFHLNAMYSYSKDRKDVYFDQYKIEGADAESFEVFSKEFNKSIDYARDKNGVYWAGRNINGADPETFRILGDGYGKDANFIYYFTEKFNVDYETFKVLGHSYVRDKNGIYREAMKLKMDPNTFEILGLDGVYSPTYVKDKNAVYFLDTKIESADPTTFQVMKDNPYAWDRNHVYFNGEVLN